MLIVMGKTLESTTKFVQYIVRIGEGVGFIKIFNYVFENGDNQPSEYSYSVSPRIKEVTDELWVDDEVEVEGIFGFPVKSQILAKRMEVRKTHKNGYVEVVKEKKSKYFDKYKEEL